MPRHPPYALHSLSPHTQTQQNTQTNHPTPQHQHHGTHTPQHRHHSTGTADSSKQLQRCSRPLSNNQTTTRKQHHSQTTPPGGHSVRPAPDPSGPNSVPPHPTPQEGCRRAPTPDHPPRPFHTDSKTAGRTRPGGNPGDGVNNVDGSTSKPPPSPEDRRLEHGGVCSLERR